MYMDAMTENERVKKLNCLFEIARLMTERSLEVARRELLNLSDGLCTTRGERTVGLSPRELDVSRLIKGGMTNKEIAALLHISQQTVEKHRHNIRKKLGITNEKVNLAVLLRDR